MDVWNAEDCGLINQASRSMLSRIGVAAEGHRAADGATTYMVGTPVYEPYQSTVMPCYDGGYEMARRVLKAVYSPEVRGSITASPVADTVRRTVATQAGGLWRGGGRPAARGLAALARIAPRKGGEVKELWAEYRRRNPGAADPIMAMRELWGSIYTWQFIRGDNAGLHDLCASVMCLTTAVDFAGAADDSGAGSHHPYQVAASEGLTCLAGPAADQVVKDMVAVGGLMTIKDELADAALATSSPTASHTVTPEEYMRALVGRRHGPAPPGDALHQPLPARQQRPGHIPGSQILYGHPTGHRQSAALQRHRRRGGGLRPPRMLQRAAPGPGFP
ncbi:hypothetical protein [Streptomyces sp. NPDC001889]